MAWDAWHVVYGMGHDHDARHRQVWRTGRCRTGVSHLGAEEGVVALLEREALRGADLAVVPVRVARDGRASAALHALEQQHRRLTPEVRGVGARGHAEVEPLVRYASHPALAQRM